MMNAVIKAMCRNANLLAAIDAYIAKADKALEDEFVEHGISNVAAALNMADKMADAIQETDQKAAYDLTAGFSLADKLDINIRRIITERIKEMNLEVQYADSFHETFSDFFDEVVQTASARLDPDIVISDYTKSSKEWLADWSHELADIMNTNDRETVTKLLEACADGTPVDELTDMIMDKGLRASKGSARRAAITETYRVNNYAEMEAMTQNPACIGKTWVHAGTPAQPRENHVRLDGVTIPVNERFSLRGIKGGILYPMAPHDTILPVEEVVHCGCTVRGKTSDEILSRTPEEKARMQAEIIRERDLEWEKEFNERNKAASGINFDTVKIDEIKGKTREEQIKYFGGGKSGETRLKLIETGTISTDDDLKNLYKIGSNGKRQLKTLKELRNSGIINYAKGTDLFVFDEDDIPSDAIVKPSNIVKNLETTTIGKETLEYLEKNKIYPQLIYEPQYHSNRGEQQGDVIKIYLDNIKNETVAAQTLIHEVTHHKYNIGGCQWAEAVCFAKEKMHITGKDYLTPDEARYIVNLARDNYPEMEWKKGGYKNGKKF